MSHKILILITLFSIQALSQQVWFVKFTENTDKEIIDAAVRNNDLLSSNKSLSSDAYKVSYLARGISQNLPGLDKILKITGNKSFTVTESWFDEKLAGSIDYLQPATTYKINSTPNDSLYSSQWALTKIQAPAAWQLTGSEDSIIVAIIDTGIDYLHPDLAGKIHFNSDETGTDAQGNDKRSNDIDDDGNGFIDDYMGWDFTYRKGFPYDSTGGDYLDWDNDPLDDNIFSHGTAVAGIIGAQTNNISGIAGTAPGVRLMNLRTFDPDGFGEEDDVASALLYAVLNGAKVVNMSFGDNSFSYVLRDVIRYAYNRNVVLVASSGNSTSTAPHYPSGYSEVICVGNSTIDDYVASSSNYGSTLDLVAPGTSIMTTVRKGKYSEFNGTSAAAPFVSAAAALILSKGNFTNEEVKQIIKSSADDLGEPGWDLRSGSGRLNLLKALSQLGASIVKFDFPLQDHSVINDTLIITATVLSPNFRNYTLSLGIGLNPDSWTELIPYSSAQVLRENIFTLTMGSMADTVYTLRLKMLQSNGLFLEERVNFRKSSTLPTGDLVSILPAYYGNSSSIVSAFYTPEPTIVKMYYREEGTTVFSSVSLDAFTQNNFFVKRLHYGFTPPGFTEFNKIYEIYYEIINVAGLSSTVKDSAGNYFRIKTLSAFNLKEYTQLSYSLPTGALYEEPVSVSSSNQVFYSDLRNLSKTFLYTLTSSGLILTDSLSERIIKDFGDFNSNGKKNILANWGRDGYVLEQESASSSTFKDIVKRENSKSWPVFAKDIDFDGKTEVFFIADDTTGFITRFNAAGGLDSVSQFKNFSPYGFGGNVFDYPAAVTGDVTGDGIDDLIMTDSDGDVMVFQIINNTAVPKPEFSFSTGFLSSSAYLATGDFNGDGIKDFALLLQSVPELDIAKFHRLIVFSYLPGSLLVHLDQAFVDPSGEFNLFSRKAYNTLKFDDLNADGKDELVLFAFPYAYILQYQTSGSEVIFYRDGINTNFVFTGDLNQNGLVEIAVPEADSLRFYEFFSTSVIPFALKGNSTLDSAVTLTWKNTSGLVYIFRGEAAQPLLKIDSVNGNTYRDNSVVAGKSYIYAVSKNVSLLPGNNSGNITVYHHFPGQVTSFQMVTSNSIKVSFSQRVGTTIPDPEVFTLFSNGTVNRISSITSYDQFSYLLSFSEEFRDSNLLNWRSFADYYGAPIMPDSIKFIYTPATQPGSLYIIASKIIDPYTIELEFNYAVDSSQAFRAENYLFSPVNGISAIRYSDASRTRILLSTRGFKPVGSLGLEYRLQVKNLFSDASSGNLPVLSESGSIVILSSFADDLSKVYVYPSPASLQKTSIITFANLPQRARVLIYSLNGISINELTEKDGNGGLSWNLRDRNDKVIPSGIYFYKIIQTDSQGNELSSKIEKFTVVR
ncbi:MAG: S8 family serine peptidase [Ignavibacteriaceae bacterium]|nr:S8 family serine peptidase [Ignavibacteriaceae bacterium]